MVTQVEQLIADKQLEYRLSGRDVLIKCLNPEHVDRNPSLRVDKLTGIGHCFACGFKLNIFNYFGLNSDVTAINVAKLKDKIKKVFSESCGLKMPSGAEPFAREFKNIPGQVLLKYGAFTHKDFEERIVFPLKDSRDKIVAFIGRHREPYGKPRYLISPRDVELPLFPAKLTHEHGTIVAVEGIFDALNLIAKGIPNVMAIMGTQGLGSLGKGLNKEKVLQLKVAGIRKIVLLMDGDAAGKKAAEILEPLLVKEGFIVENVELDDGEDPGNLSSEQVDILKRYI